jgi:hypothetical protein
VRLTVVAGPAGTGKIARGYEAMAPDPHRDQVRVLMGRPIPEEHLTRLLGSMATCLLATGHNVVTVGQNLYPGDRTFWQAIAACCGAELVWETTTCP